MAIDQVRHVHVHLPAPEPGTELHIHIGVADDGHAEPEGSTAAADVEAMLDRLAGYANGVNVRKLYKELLAIGYQSDVPRVRKEGKNREPYLRWTDPANPGAAALNYDTASAYFGRKADWAKLAKLPGAHLTDRSVRFSIATATGVEQALAAAKAVKA